MKYVIAGIIILLVLLFDLLVSRIRENDDKNIVDIDLVVDTITVVDYDCMNMGNEHNHNSLDMIREGDHNYYMPERKPVVTGSHNVYIGKKD